MSDPLENAAKQRDLGDLQRAMLAIFSGSLARSVARILLIVFVIRLYGLESFGYLGEVAALVELFAALASYGLPKTLLAYIEKEKSQARPEGQLISDAILLSGIISVVFGLLLLTAWPFIFPVDSNVPSYAVAAITLIAVTEMLLTITRAQRIIRWDTLVKAVVKPWGFFLFNVCGYFLFVEKGLLLPVEALFAGYLASQILGLVLALTGFRHARHQAKFHWMRPRLDGMNRLLKKSFSTAIVDAGSFSFRRLDIILLGLIAGPAATGFYYLIQQLATVVEKMRHLLEPMAAPVLAQSKSLSTTGAHLRRLCLWIFSAQTGLAAIYLLFAEPVLHSFNIMHTQMILIVALILIGEIAEGTSGLVELPLIFDHPNIASRNIVAAFLVEIAFVTFGASYWGIVGVAGGFAMAMTLLAFLRFRSAQAKLELDILGLAYAKPLAAAIAVTCMAMGAGTIITANSVPILVFGIAACAITYLVMLRLLGVSMQITKLP